MVSPVLTEKRKEKSMLKDFIGEILPFVLFGVMFFLPPILIIIDIVFLVKKKEHPIFESIAFFVGTAEMFFAYFIWDLPPYTQPLNIYGIGIKMSLI